MGSSAGLLCYDGYEVRDWQGGGVEQMMTGVVRLTEDSVGYLWAGTRDGLVRLNLETGRTRAYRLPKQSQQVIFALFTASDGTVYAGTDDGFSVYNAEVDSFYNFNCENTVAIYPNGRRDTVWHFSVKDFAELPDGDMLIGTWSGGLLRFSPRRQTFRAYGRLNEMNSAFSLYVDDLQRIWIGTWAYGVQRIDRADDYTLSTLQTMAVQNGPVRKMSGNPIDGGVRWTTEEERGIYPVDGCRLWVLTTKQLVQERGNDSPFRFQAAEKSVRALYVDGSGHVITDSGENNINIFDILLTKNGDLLMAAEEQGIRVFHADGSRDKWHWGNTKWLRDNVYAFCQTRDGSLWVGQRMGLSVLRPDGTGQHLDIKTDSVDLTGYFIVNHILEDYMGNLWVCSANRGLVRIKKASTNSPVKGEDCAQLLPSPARGVGGGAMTATFEDSHHRLWAYSANGLFLFDRDKNRFEAAHERFHLPSAKIYSINEDADGVLWLGTGRGLVRLEIMADGETVVSAFTEEDGLPASSFLPRATFRRTDTLYFGMADGYLSFVPSAIAHHSSNTTHQPSLLVTDIFIDGKSFTDLDSAFAARISPNMPAATQMLTIPASVKTFSIELALLTYNHTAQTRYAYRLEGRDADWIFLEPGSRRVMFSALPTGRYKLHLRAVNSHGEHIDLPSVIDIRVLPPWYATWWAYLIYILCVSAIIWFVWHYIQLQREIVASRRFTAIMQSVELAPYSSPEGAAAQYSNESSVVLSSGSERGASAFIARATQLVREHLDDSEYNRDRMAADMGMSASSLFSKLREATGMNIQTFIQNIRLNTAAEILRSDPDIRISELAYRVGFNTPKYFSQCFKKEFGVLPGEYVRTTVD